MNTRICQKKPIKYGCICKKIFPKKFCINELKIFLAKIGFFYLQNIPKKQHFQFLVPNFYKRGTKILFSDLWSPSLFKLVPNA